MMGNRYQKEFDLADLVSTKKDDVLHTSRTMFFIYDGHLVVQKINCSHVEWFQEYFRESITPVVEALESSTRGFYCPFTDALYFYTGIGFYFNQDVYLEAQNFMRGLYHKIPDVSFCTRVVLGPKDEQIKGKRWSKVDIGSVIKFVDVSEMP